MDSLSLVQIGIIEHFGLFDSQYNSPIITIYVYISIIHIWRSLALGQIWILEAKTYIVYMGKTFRSYFFYNLRIWHSLALGQILIIEKIFAYNFYLTSIFFSYKLKPQNREKIGIRIIRILIFPIIRIIRIVHYLNIN